MGSVDPTGNTPNVMKPQCPIKPLPEVAVPNRGHTPVEFPFPTAASPIGQALLQAVTDVSAAADERDFRRFIERLKRPDKRQQFQAIPSDRRFHIGSLKTRSSVGVANREPPATGSPPVDVDNENVLRQ